MDFDTFKEDLAKAVKDRLELIFDRKYSVETHTVEKMNQSYEALVVKPEDGVIGVNIGIDAAFKEYSDGRSFDMIVRQIASAAEHALDNHPAFDLEALTDYSQMKGKLAMEVVSAERNAELLETVPHKNMEDMAIVYRFVLDTVEAGRGSILVTNKMLDNYGITAEQLHNDAMEIAPEVRPAVIKGMSEVLADMMGAEQAQALGLGPVADEPIFVATVEDQAQGAGILAYQNFMDEAAEKLGGECLGLRWEDLDFENRTIDVNHNLVHRRVDEEGGTLHINTPKTKAGCRTVPMIQQVYDAFLEEYQLQQLTGFCTQEVEGYSGFVFASSNGTVTLPIEVNRAIHSLIDDYNEEEKANARTEGRNALILPRISAHHLRHTFCTRLCETETNVKVIQTIMGHKDIQTTLDIYADCTEEKKKEVIHNIEDKIFIL